MGIVDDEKWRPQHDDLDVVDELDIADEFQIGSVSKGAGTDEWSVDSFQAENMGSCEMDSRSKGVTELSFTIDGYVLDLLPVGVVDLDVESVMIGFADMLKDIVAFESVSELGEQ